MKVEVGKKHKQRGGDVVIIEEKKYYEHCGKFLLDARYCDRLNSTISYTGSGHFDRQDKQNHELDIVEEFK